MSEIFFSSQMKWRFGVEFLCAKVGDHCSLENLPDSGFNSRSKCLSNLRNKYLKVLYNICQPCVSFPSQMTLSSGGNWIEAGIVLQTRIPTFICVSSVGWVSKLPPKTVLGWRICSKPPLSITLSTVRVPRLGLAPLPPSSPKSLENSL